MRITHDIVDDGLRAAKERARREKKSTGKIISELARSAPAAGSATVVPKAHCGLRSFPSRRGSVTNDLVDTPREEAAD